MMGVASGERDVDKCIGCQHYDRQLAKPGDAKGMQWGQCRRSAPMLHPINAKSYMIEGVWPHVRDDDWCGEWKAMARRLEPRALETVSGPLVAGRNPSSPPATRPATLAALQGNGPGSGMPPPGHAVASPGRGD